jgi:hypothetical protein
MEKEKYTCKGMPTENLTKRSHLEGISVDKLTESLPKFRSDHQDA